jgi:hypothetical protein
METKDSGEQVKFSTGMVRDVSRDKPRFDLIMPKDIPYKEQVLTRWAELMQRGAVHYSARNWEKAATQEELDRFQESALRHMMQWLNNETDEDHAVAVMFNLTGAEMIKSKLNHFIEDVINPKFKTEEIPPEHPKLSDDEIVNEFENKNIPRS